MDYVVLPDHGIQYLRWLSNFITLFGLYLWLASLYDLMEDDVYGFAQLSRFKKEGEEMPTPFFLKRLSRIALSCRHPLYTGIMITLLGPLLHDTITLGRLIYALNFTLGVYVGSQLEER